MTSIGILIETKNGKIKKSDYGVITATGTGESDLSALLLQETALEAKEELQKYGINNIIEIRSDRAALPWNPEIWADAILQAMQHFNIKILLGTAGFQGKELLPRIAAQLDAPLIMDCVSVNLLHKTAGKFLYSGKIIAELKISGEYTIFGIRPNAIEAVPVSNPANTETTVFNTMANPRRLEVKEIVRNTVSDTDLTEADIILSGGRAMQNGENFGILRECATAMNAVVGASRVAVDAGWVPHAMQVGQTGKTVSPKVYIACGISGSVQHFAGMKTSSIIIAVNTDRNAAITANCDYFAVVDLFELVPALTKKLKQSTNNIV